MFAVRHFFTTNSNSASAFSQKNYRNIDLPRVYESMQNNKNFLVEYNVELFAGMYFKPKQKHYPTILFFLTGSFTMMGGRNEDIKRM